MVPEMTETQEVLQLVPEVKLEVWKVLQKNLQELPLLASELKAGVSEKLPQIVLQLYCEAPLLAVQSKLEG